jgi:hypothetical protein
MLYSGAGVKAKVDQRFGIGVTVKEIQGVLLLETWPMFPVTHSQHFGLTLQSL